MYDIIWFTFVIDMGLIIILACYHSYFIRWHHIALINCLFIVLAQLTIVAKVNWPNRADNITIETTDGTITNCPSSGLFIVKNVKNFCPSHITHIRNISSVWIQGSNFELSIILMFQYHFLVQKIFVFIVFYISSFILSFYQKMLSNSY